MALARALAKQPEILLLDEPFSHIDNFKKQSLRRSVFKYLKEKNIACIVATHDKNDVLGFADKMLVLHNKTIIAQDTPKNLYANPKLPLIQNFNNISSMHFSQEEKNIIKKYLFKLINDYCFRRDILNEEEVQFGKQYILYHGFNYSRQAYEMLYHELTEFFNRYGRLPTASKVKNRGSEELLASRLFTIKKMYRDKKLSAKLFDLFSKLPNMSWAHRKDSEDERFRIALKDLKEFSITKKRFPKVSSKDPKEKYLAGFIASKEQGFKNGLSIHRKKEFYAIIKEIDKYFIQNNIIKPKKILRSFEDWIVILKDYLKNSGLNHVSARVIVKDRNNVDAALGTWWLNTIKAKYKKGNLKASHQRILKEMGMNLDL